MYRLLIALGLVAAASFWGNKHPEPPSHWKTTGANSSRLLHREYAEATGFSYFPRQQGQSPNCVGQAISAAIDITEGISGERLPANVDAAFIYGVSRVDNGFTVRAGSMCSWAAQSAVEVGVVPMLEYPLLGLDLTTESVRRSASYGSTGPPEELRVVAESYRLSEYYQVKNWQQLRGAIKSGYPVIVGSNVGFGAKSGNLRDQSGFLYSARWRGWAHAMVIIAYEDRPGHKPGALVLNSWGPSWVLGPQKFGDEPLGSFWITPSDVNRMLGRGDSFAIGKLK
jgi:hypothetical protein